MNRIVAIEKQMQESKTEPRIIGDIPLDYEEDIDINLIILEDESLKQPESIITQSNMPLIIQWNFVEKNKKLNI